MIIIIMLIILVMRMTFTKVLQIAKVMMKTNTTFNRINMAKIIIKTKMMKMTFLLIVGVMIGSNINIIIGRIMGRNAKPLVGHN